MTRGRTAKVLTQHWDGAALLRRPDHLIVEEPLEVHLDGNLVGTTMRTPGHDFELAVGLVHGDGLLAGAPVLSCRYCATGSAVDSDFNVVSVDTGGAAPTPHAAASPPPPRRAGCAARPPSRSCATGSRRCPSARRGRSSCWPTSRPPSTRTRTCSRAPERSTPRPPSTAPARPLVVREDIGRHNAVDKVVGRLLLDGALPATDLGLYVSGRAGFEIVQKAWAAGFSALVAVERAVGARGGGGPPVGHDPRGVRPRRTTRPPTSTAPRSPPDGLDASS